jgi:uncharacterized protein (TIGR02996 family)
MTDKQQAAFLEAIREAPDDDTPRLVYADWLQERCDPRGEFIAVQCSLEKLDEDDDRRAELTGREQTLLREHGPAWRDELPQWARKACSFERGFITRVCCQTEDFLADPERLVRATPLESLRPFRCGGRCKELAACPSLAGVTELDLAGSEFQPGDLTALGQSRFLRRLRSLILNECELRAPGVRALADGPAFAGLRSLSLRGCALNAAALRHLAGSRYLGNLTDLVLESNEIGTGLASLAASPVCSNLETVNLEECELNRGRVQALTDSPHLGRLRELKLSRNGVGYQGMIALATSGRLKSLTHLEVGDDLAFEDSPPPKVFPKVRTPRLVWLDLYLGSLGDDATQRLAGWNALARLTHLLLSNNAIRTDGAAALARSPHLANLTHLDLNGNDLGPHGAEALAASPVMKRLKFLGLGSNQIGSRGATALAKARPLLAELRHFELYSNDIDDETGAALASVPALAQLRRLHLADNDLGPKTAAALARADHLARLEELNIHSNQLGNEGAQAVAASPHLRLLATLNLESNGIRVRGVQALAGSPVLATVSELNLGTNPLGDGGTRALAGSPNLGRLLRLVLYYCRIADAGARSLAGSPALAGLLELTLSDNSIGDAVKAVLQRRFGDRVRF